MKKLPSPNLLYALIICAALCVSCNNDGDPGGGEDSTQTNGLQQVDTVTPALPVDTVKPAQPVPTEIDRRHDSLLKYIEYSGKSTEYRNLRNEMEILYLRTGDESYRRQGDWYDDQKVKYAKLAYRYQLK